MEEGAQRYEVDRIVGWERRDGEVFYKVEWKGYKTDEATFESEAALIEDGCSEEIEAFKGRWNRANPNRCCVHVTSMCYLFTLHVYILKLVVLHLPYSSRYHNMWWMTWVVCYCKRLSQGPHRMFLTYCQELLYISPRIFEELVSFLLT